jgi:hypothetical protein
MEANGWKGGIAIDEKKKVEGNHAVFTNSNSNKPGAGLAQAVQCLTTGWTTGRSEFDSRRGKGFFL